MDGGQSLGKEIREPRSQALCPCYISEHHPLHPRGASCSQNESALPLSLVNLLALPPPRVPPARAVSNPNPSQPAVSACHSLSSETCLSMCLPPHPT